MFSDFGGFITCIKEARFTFGIIWQAIVNFCTAVFANPDVSEVKDGLLGLIQPVYRISLIVGIVLALILAFFGKKLIGVVKFIAFFLAGFLIGTHLLPQLLPQDVELPSWIIGIVVALIAAVLARFLYIILYIGISGYSVYVLTYYGFFLTPAPVYSNTRALGSLVFALVMVIVLLIFKKYVEMLGTAMLGSWLSVILFTKIYDFTKLSLFVGIEWLAILIFSGVIALFAFAVQVKTRKRY